MKQGDCATVYSSEGIPHVVGTVSSLEGFQGVVASLSSQRCDVLEVRLGEGELPVDSDWRSGCQKVEEAGIPVIITTRSKVEGGPWDDEDPRRLEIQKCALDSLTTVDVELRSALAPEIVAYANERGKVPILSYHDFDQTPSGEELQNLVGKALALGKVLVKMTTMVRNPGDIERLQSILSSFGAHPLCVIGMGELGAETRIAFPMLGSLLTYGYLDRSTAPGQFSCAELSNALRERLPAYEAYQTGAS